jgi:hypothetical protein
VLVRKVTQKATGFAPRRSPPAANPRDMCAFSSPRCTYTSSLAPSSGVGCQVACVAIKTLNEGWVRTRSCNEWRDSKCAQKRIRPRKPDFNASHSTLRLISTGASIIRRPIRWLETDALLGSFCSYASLRSTELQADHSCSPARVPEAWPPLISTIPFLRFEHISAS